jgi:hypothetical protein
MARPLLFGTRENRGEPHVERSAFLLFAFESDLAAMRLDNFLGHGQSKTGRRFLRRAAPSRGREGFKQMLPERIRDPDAGVPHADHGTAHVLIDVDGDLSTLGCVFANTSSASVCM